MKELGQQNNGWPSVLVPSLPWPPLPLFLAAILSLEGLKGTTLVWAPPLVPQVVLASETFYKSASKCSMTPCMTACGRTRRYWLFCWNSCRCWGEVRPLVWAYALVPHTVDSSVGSHYFLFKSFYFYPTKLVWKTSNRQQHHRFQPPV